MIPAELQLTVCASTGVHVPAVNGAPASVTVNEPGANTTVTSLASPSVATNDNVAPVTETADAWAAVGAASAIRATPDRTRQRGNITA